MILCFKKLIIGSLSMRKHRWLKKLPLLKNLKRKKLKKEKASAKRERKLADRWGFLKLTNYLNKFNFNKKIKKN